MTNWFYLVHAIATDEDVPAHRIDEDMVVHATSYTDVMRKLGEYYGDENIISVEVKQIGQENDILLLGDIC